MLTSDCRNSWTRQGERVASRPHLPLDARFLILRETDQCRTWSSLDDKRVCILCDKQFSGRQVEITRSRTGRYELHCPTDGCNAGPSQWVYPGNPLVSKVAYADWQRALMDSDMDAGPRSPISAAA
jgi:hypothetical protein